MSKMLNFKQSSAKYNMLNNVGDYFKAKFEERVESFGLAR